MTIFSRYSFGSLTSINFGGVNIESSIIILSISSSDTDGKRGSSIAELIDTLWITSNNEYFDTFIEKWWDITNSEKKWSQFIFSLLITGSAIMELQYTPPEGNRKPRMGNLEQIPMQTIYRLFRDQFANELKIVQIVDGVFKELDPQFFIHQKINNPDRQAF